MAREKAKSKKTLLEEEKVRQRVIYNGKIENIEIEDEVFDCPKEALFAERAVLDVDIDEETGIILLRDIAISRDNDNKKAEKYMDTKLEPNKKLVDEFIRSHVKVSEDVAIGYMGRYTVIIDGINGKVYHFQTEKIEFKIDRTEGSIFVRGRGTIIYARMENGVLIKEKAERPWNKIFDNKQFNTKCMNHIGVILSGRDLGTNKAYPTKGLSWPYPNMKVVYFRIHTLVAILDNGYAVLDTMQGPGKVKDTHHRDGNSKNNKRTNLSVVTQDQHNDLHNEYEYESSIAY